MTQRPSVRQSQRDILNQDLSRLENILQADVLTIFGPILPGLEKIVKGSVERIQNRRYRITVVLDTIGGIVEVVERMVTVIRYHYDEVHFIVPRHSFILRKKSTDSNRKRK